MVSKTGSVNSNFKTFTFAAIGVYLIGLTAWKYFSAGITDGMLPNLIIGASAFFVLKYQKIVYMSPASFRRTGALSTAYARLSRRERERRLRRGGVQLRLRAGLKARRRERE